MTAGTIALEIPGWFATVSVSLCATIIVVILEMRKRSYHGVGWQKINPELPAWWEAHARLSRETAQATPFAGKE